MAEVASREELEANLGEYKEQLKQVCAGVLGVLLAAWATCGPVFIFNLLRKCWSHKGGLCADLPLLLPLLSPAGGGAAAHGRGERER